MVLFQQITTALYLGILSLLWCCNFCVGTLFFPTNTVLGLIFAIAVPLELPHRNVFLSYNFEANYNLPDKWGIPPIATGIEDDDIFNLPEAARQMSQPDDSCTNCTDAATTSTTITPPATTTTATTNTVKPKVNATSNGGEESHHQHRRNSAINSLLTRTRVYHILSDIFEKSGYNGEPCLLSLICETNFSSIGEVNGILGTLVHILFSPSTSANENLPLPYYQAEVDGAHGFCKHYEAECKENPLHLISVRLGDIIDNFMGSQ